MVGITGSNGKTIIKEWLAQFLDKDYTLIKSPKSYNSQLGVPLSVWQITSEHDFAIFEAGISTINEMQNLESIIKPSIGILTNIGTAHEKGFESIEQKIKEKLKLFKDCQTLIYCQDHELIHNEISKLANTADRTFSWSFNKKSNVQIKKVGSQEYKLIFNEKASNFQLPFHDDASLENVLHCIVCLLFLKIEALEIQKSMS